MTCQLGVFRDHHISNLSIFSVCLARSANHIPSWSILSSTSSFCPTTFSISQTKSHLQNPLQSPKFLQYPRILQQWNIIFKFSRFHDWCYRFRFQVVSYFPPNLRFVKHIFIYSRTKKKQESRSQIMKWVQNEFWIAWTCHAQHWILLTKKPNHTLGTNWARPQDPHQTSILANRRCSEESPPYFSRRSTCYNILL